MLSTSICDYKLQLNIIQLPDYSSNYRKKNKIKVVVPIGWCQKAKATERTIAREVEGFL
jgi:hypothetical protein